VTAANAAIPLEARNARADGWVQYGMRNQYIWQRFDFAAQIPTAGVRTLISLRNQGTRHNRSQPSLRTFGAISQFILLFKVYSSAARHCKPIVFSISGAAEKQWLEISPGNKAPKPSRLLLTRLSEMSASGRSTKPEWIAARCSSCHGPSQRIPRRAFPWNHSLDNFPSG